MTQVATICRMVDALTLDERQDVLDYLLADSDLPTETLEAQLRIVRERMDAFSRDEMAETDLADWMREDAATQW